MSTSGGSSGGAAQITTVHVTAAQVATCATSPIALVASPGPTKALGVLAAYGEWVPGAGAFASFGLSLAYTSLLSSNNIGVFNNAALKSGPPVHDVELIPSQSDVFDSTLIVGQGLVTGLSGGVDPDPIGAIVTTTLAAGGTGYAPNDTGTVDGAQYGTAAAYKVLTVGGGGAVLTYSITSPGAAYTTVANPLTTATGGGQPGIGTGLTLNVATIAAPTGDLYVTVAYVTFTGH